MKKISKLELCSHVYAMNGYTKPTSLTWLSVLLIFLFSILEFVRTWYFFQFDVSQRDTAFEVVWLTLKLLSLERGGLKFMLAPSNSHEIVEQLFNVGSDENVVIQILYSFFADQLRFCWPTMCIKIFVFVIVNTIMFVTVNIDLKHQHRRY